MHKNGEEFVVNFVCAKSHRISILHNLTDMCQKASASFGLHMGRMPMAYQQAQAKAHWWKERLTTQILSDPAGE
jgi:hypothetical protein